VSSPDQRPASGAEADFLVLASSLVLRENY